MKMNWQECAVCVYTFTYSESIKEDKVHMLCILKIDGNADGWEKKILFSINFNINMNEN